MYKTYNDSSEVAIKIDTVDLIEVIKQREKDFDDFTAKLFIEIYTDMTDNVYDQYPYSLFLNNTAILSKEELLKEYEYIGDCEAIKKYKKEIGLEEAIDLITEGKNKGKYLVIKEL